MNHEIFLTSEHFELYVKFLRLMKRKFCYFLFLFNRLSQEGKESPEEEINQIWKSLPWDERFKQVANLEECLKDSHIQNPNESLLNLSSINKKKKQLKSQQSNSTPSVKGFFSQNSQILIDKKQRKILEKYSKNKDEIPNIVIQKNEEQINPFFEKISTVVINLKLLPLNYLIQIDGKDILRTIQQKRIDELKNGIILNLEHPFDINEISELLPQCTTPQYFSLTQNPRNQFLNDESSEEWESQNKIFNLLNEKYNDEIDSVSEINSNSSNQINQEEQEIKNQEELIISNVKLRQNILFGENAIDNQKSSASINQSVIKEESPILIDSAQENSI